MQVYLLRLATSTMRFLEVFVAAVIGFAATIHAMPMVTSLHASAGDIQAALINANVEATDQARVLHEGQARASEAAIQHNIEAARQVAEGHRDIKERSHWDSVAHNQYLLSAAQAQVAAIDGASVAARAAYLPGYAGGLRLAYAAPWGYGPWRLGYHSYY